MLSETSQTQKATYCIMFHLYEISRIGKSIEIEHRVLFNTSYAHKEQGVIWMGMGIIRGDENVLEPERGDDCTMSWMD